MATMPTPKIFDECVEAYRKLDKDIIDPEIRKLIARINTVPGVVTVWSCASHPQYKDERWHGSEGYISCFYNSEGKNLFSYMMDKLLTDVDAASKFTLESTEVRPSHKEFYEDGMRRYVSCIIRWNSISKVHRERIINLLLKYVNEYIGICCV